MKLRVMVVEDEADIRKGICIELAHSMRGDLHFETCEADDLAMALDLLASPPMPDLILTDIMMPSGQWAGLTLIEALKKHPQWKRIPVIVLSARTTAKDILDALKLGAIDYLVKPFEPAELIERVLRAAEYGRAPCRPPGAPETAEQRKLLVEAMKLALLYWELSTQRSKIQFADESGQWRIYIDKRGTCSCKTLDKYLHVESLPANPKIHNVEKSLHFVLGNCHGHSAIRGEIELLLGRLLNRDAVIQGD